MRRSNRSIEVFDISLMAVVTKAMGAFLVIMLLLMPYYKSGPVGEKTAAELAKELNEAQKQLKHAIDNMKTSNIDPRELERLKLLLEEAQRRLQQAQMLADRLKRENDQLNSQVSRLESELNESKRKLAEEKKKNDQLENQLAQLIDPVLSMRLINSDCLDVVMDVALWNRKRDKIEYINGPSVKYTLNYYSPGYSFINRRLLPQQNVTGFRTNVYKTPNVVILVVRDKKSMKIDGQDGYLLKKTSKACNVTIDIDTFIPKNGDYSPWGTTNMTIPRATYAKVLWGAKAVKDKIVLTDPTAEDKAWLQQEVAKAKKVPEVKPPPPKKIVRENKPISKQEALAEIDKLRIPRSPGECMDLVGRAGAILSRARVHAPPAKSLDNVQRACRENNFDGARKMVQSLAREAITGKKTEDVERQSPKSPINPILKHEALAQLEKLKVPHSVNECMQMIRQVGAVVSRLRVQMPNANWVGTIQQFCINDRFDDARRAAQAMARDAIAGNKKSENSKQQPPKNGTVKFTKQEALALIDRAPVPTDPRTCMMTAMRSMRMLVEMHAKSLESGRAFMQGIEKDCTGGRFADALKKTKDEVHRTLK